MSTSKTSPSLPIADVGSDKMTEIEQMRQEYADLQAAYKTLADRIHSESEHDENIEMEKELQSLRNRIKELETSVASITAERDELNSTVRDLRVRVEEGRRAIMRLQGQSGSSTGQEGLMPSSTASSASNLANLTTAQKQENRKSTGLGVLSSWNPREITNGQSPKPEIGNEGTTTSPPPAAQTAEELAELKKSKRASLAFGPHAHGNNTMRRMHGHRRIASGSRIGEEEDASSMPPPSHPPSAAGGLRELHLGGVSGSGTTNANTDRSSKRISILSGAYLRSPNPEAADHSTEGSPERLQAGASLLMPSKSSRRTSNSSAISNSTSGIAQLREDVENTLAPPRSMSRMSQSPSQASVSSPIVETVDLPNDFDSEPSTARANNTVGFAQQQTQSTASTSNYQLQRSLMESKAKLRDRDDQVTLLKRELTAIKNQLQEAKDAREASEACLAALKEFVKSDRNADSENGGEQTAQALKGMKLPPLPTDKDTDDIEGSHDMIANRASQSTAPSAWRSIGNTFAGLTRKQTESFDASSSNPSYSPVSEKMLNVKDTDGASEATSPTSQISSSISNFWSKATTKAEGGVQGANAGDGTTGSSTTPSEGTSGENRTDSRHTSVHSTATAGEQANPTATSPPNAGFKGFGWFAKRTVSNASDPATPANTTEVRVSSPPFANLDNHVLTLDQINTPVAAGRAASYASLTGSNTSGTPGSRKTSATSNMSFGSANALSNGVGIGIASDNVGPNGRVKKAMEMSEAVDEDNGFVPPSFTS